MTYDVRNPAFAFEDKLVEHIRRLTERRLDSDGDLICRICGGSSSCFDWCPAPAARRDAGLEE